MILDMNDEEQILKWAETEPLLKEVCSQEQVQTQTERIGGGQLVENYQQGTAAGLTIACLRQRKVTIKSSDSSAYQALTGMLYS